MLHHILSDILLLRFIMDRSCECGNLPRRYICLNLLANLPVGYGVDEWIQPSVHEVQRHTHVVCRVASDEGNVTKRNWYISEANEHCCHRVRQGNEYHCLDDIDLFFADRAFLIHAIIWRWVVDGWRSSLEFDNDASVTVDQFHQKTDITPQSEGCRVRLETCRTLPILVGQTSSVFVNDSCPGYRNVEHDACNDRECDNRVIHPPGNIWNTLQWS